MGGARVCVSAKQSAAPHPAAREPGDEQVRALYWITASGLLLAGPACAGIPTAAAEWRIGHDEGPFMDDLLDWSLPRRVPVVITADGPLPKEIEVHGRERIDLVVERSSLWDSNACRSGLALGGHDLRAPVPDGQPVVISVFAHGGIEKLDLTCPTGGAVGALGH
jgi:hypothetical protein